jgi:hypothetical protein
MGWMGDYSAFLMVQNEPDDYEFPEEALKDIVSSLDQDTDTTVVLVISKRKINKPANTRRALKAVEALLVTLEEDEFISKEEARELLGVGKVKEKSYECDFSKLGTDLY